MVEYTDVRLNKWRVRKGGFASTDAFGLMGLFHIRFNGAILRTLSDGGQHESGWEHVSVSVFGKDRLPTWEEMCFVKSLFWSKDEVVIQFHPAEQDYVNISETLHLWKPPYKLQMPPKEMV